MKYEKTLVAEEEICLQRCQVYSIDAKEVRDNEPIVGQCQIVCLLQFDRAVRALILSEIYRPGALVRQS